jgi:hypothetical protein
MTLHIQVFHVTWNPPTSMLQLCTVLPGSLLHVLQRAVMAGSVLSGTSSNCSSRTCYEAVDA